MNRFTIALFLLALQTSAAYTAENCSDTEDPAARLECFDRNFPPAASPASIAPQVKEPTDSVADDVLSDDILGPIPTDESIETDAVVVIEAEEPTRQKKEVKKTWSELFNFGGELDISATIVDLLNNDKQRMVFKLDNDQIWIQTSPRNLPIKKGDNITIRSARFGGYILRTEHGLSTRVSVLENG